jgi:hypothetical protein
MFIYMTTALDFVLARWANWWQGIDDINKKKNLDFFFIVFNIKSETTHGVHGLLLIGIKWHLSVGPVARHKLYYKGEGGGFPQVRIVASLVSPCLPMVCPCTKSALAMHQLTYCLVCAGLHEWLICLSLFLVPFRSFNTPFYPQSVVS